MQKYFLTIFLTFLTACGFHLRGVGDAKLEPLELYLRNLAEENFAFSSLENSLKTAGVKLLDGETEGAVVVLVSNFYTNSRQTATGGSRNDSREIEINSGYEIKVLRNSQILGETNLNARSSIQSTPAQYSGNAQEAEEVRKQLAEENANSAIRFINATIKKQ